MADVRLNSITFPDLPNRYFVKDYDAIVAKMMADIYNAYPSKSLPSAPIHAFGDGADNIPIKAMEVAVRAVQDLHGQSAPYPAGGGGVNKIVDLDTSNNYQQYAGVCFIKADIPTGTTITVSFVGANGFAWYNDTFFGSVRTGTFNGTRQSFTGTLAIDLTTSDWQTLFKSAAGNTAPANVRDVMIEIGSSASPYQPYENICPISGWTQAQIVGSGKNLLDNRRGSSATTINGVTFTPQSDGSVIVNGTASGGAAIYTMWNRGSDNVRLPAGTYTLSGCPSGGTTSTYFMQFQATRSGELHGYGNETGNGLTATVQEGDIQQVTIRVANGATANNIRFYPQLELGNTKTAYVPYNGRIITIVFKDAQGNPMIAYGGPLRYVGGLEYEFTPTHAAVDMGSLEWTRAATAIADAYRFQTPQNPVPALLPSDDYHAANIIADAFSPITANATYTPTTGVALSATGRVIVYADAYKTMTADQFKAAMNGITLMYQLATPLDPITLTADAETVTEYGDNVLWADCGDSSLTYRQDIGLVLGE